MSFMRRGISLLLVLSVGIGGRLQVLRSRGLIRGGECGPVCDCSVGVRTCRCGHPTCLSPVL